MSLKETELKYTVNNLVSLSRQVWGDNSTEFLAGALDSLISYNQLTALIDKLQKDADELT